MYMLWNCWIITKRVNGWSMAGKQQAKYEDMARLCTWDVDTLQYLQARLTEATIRRKIDWMSCGWDVLQSRHITNDMHCSKGLS